MDYKLHPLINKEEYVRNMYFDMLFVVAQYECSDTENAFNMIKNIMSSCEEVLPLEEYIKRSKQLTTDKITEFVKLFKENELSEIFYVDAVLLICSNYVANKKQIAFISQIGDIFGFDKAKSIFLSKIIKSILEQNGEVYKEAYLEYIHQDVNNILDNTRCYIENYSNVPKYLCYSSDLLNTEKPRYGISGYITDYYYGDWDVVVFNNQYFIEKFDNRVAGIDLYYYRIPFERVKTLIIRGCKFYNTTISITDFDNVIIENCEFMADRIDRYPVMKIESYDSSIFSASNIHISNCSFDGYNNSNAFIGSSTVGIENEIKNSKTNTKIVIEKCRFKNLKGKFSSFISIDNNDKNQMYVSLHDCEFSNCYTSYSHTNLIEYRYDGIHIDSKNININNCNNASISSRF